MQKKTNSNSYKNSLNNRQYGQSGSQDSGGGGQKTYNEDKSAMEKEFFRHSEAAHFVLQENKIVLTNPAFDNIFLKDTAVSVPLTFSILLDQFEGTDARQLADAVKLLKENGHSLSVSCRAKPLSSGACTYQLTGNRSSTNAEMLLFTAIRVNAPAGGEPDMKHYELKTIINSSPDVIARYNTELQHVFINPAITAFSKHSPAYYIGKSFRELKFIEPVLNEWEQHAREAIESRNVQSLIAPISDINDGGFLEISFYPESMKGEGVETLLVITRDITRHKKAQHAAEKITRTLEERVERRTQQIEEARRSLEEEVLKRTDAEIQIRELLQQEKALNELKSRFISLVSHEFRTPLSTVFSSTELLELYGHRLTDSQKNKHLHKIKQSVENLILMLNDVSSLAETDPERAKLKLTVIDIISIMRELIEEAKNQAREYPHIYFTASETDLRFTSDEQLFRQLVLNLLSNSIKYTSIKKNIYIHIEREGNSLKLTITDEGIGITETDKERLFEPFQRGSNTTGIKGTGLGMTIIRRVLNLLKGELSLESEPGKGTRFAVRLPLINAPTGK